MLSQAFSSPLPFPQLREHLAKGQRTLAGEGMSQIVRSLLELMSRHSYYSGDLLFSVEILRNVTDTFKRATYIPAPDDVQVDHTYQPRYRWTCTCVLVALFLITILVFSVLQKFFQIVSLMLDMDNLQKWEDAHQVMSNPPFVIKTCLSADEQQLYDCCCTLVSLCPLISSLGY